MFQSALDFEVLKPPEGVQNLYPLCWLLLQFGLESLGMLASFYELVRFYKGHKMMRWDRSTFILGWVISLYPQRVCPYFSHHDLRMALVKRWA
ncbi:hypothetical protein P154DRAFT_523602 [Amniculicola lignicola CBS 123094]|uniref:Uncharacterized protein n=1 Tax=Amniculicola lignicola CBS 123094 TaxID=1392246 RepID=A0A6A5WC09_9PLEO|nr:hypothetical protein P154DRAFT_523602 [Amniculicola lignicola CBS 123094]